MMDHIRLRDWCASRRYNEEFVDEQDIEHCTIEKIIRNRFWDPMISSDEDEPIGIIDWDNVFKKKNAKEQRYRLFVPGFRTAPPHPKLSALTRDEHRQCVKVLCAKNTGILPKEFLGRTCKSDYKTFEEKKEIYAAEQKEYLEWAKKLWITTNCIRALRPKPMVEMVYEAEFKMKTHMMQCFPKTYWLAAQIPLRAENQKCEIIFPKRDLIKVDISNLPEMSYPNIYESKVSVLQACAVPEPCTQHPCKFTLPNETSVSLLPLTEVHKELAQYSIENGADYIASENAIKCILEMDRSWTLPVSVCEVIAADGEKSHVVVLGSEFPMKKDPAPMRSYRAYRHFLLKAFTLKSTRSRTLGARSRLSSTRSSMGCETNFHKKYTRRNQGNQAAVAYTNMLRKIIDQNESSDDSDENDRLEIDLDDDNQMAELKSSAGDKTPKAANSTNEDRRSSTDCDNTPRKILKARRSNTQQDNTDENHENKNDSNEDFFDIGLFNCVCKDTEFEVPAPRSFKNLQIKNISSKEHTNIIIHSAHKLKNKKLKEVIIEPILEYQLDIGATQQSPQKLQSLAFSLMLRKNADLINVRLDAVGGELVTIDTTSLKEITANHGNFMPDTANIMYTVLNQLAGLLPGAYLLRHEPSHGCNALLYSRSTRVGADGLSLEWADAAPPAADEARAVQAAPALAPVLLPYHKFRRQLPLAFTYDQNQVAKETSKLVTKNKIPPAAIQWPKRKRGRKGKNTQQY